MQKIEINEDIGAYFGYGKRAFLDATKDFDRAKPLHIVLNSPGGEIAEGLAIYSEIRNWGGETTVTVVGMALSAASIVLLAADKRNIQLGSVVMIHNPWTIANGERKDFEKEAEVLGKFEDCLASIYALRLGIDREEARAWMDAETWFTAETAKEVGLVDEIIDGPEVVAVMPYRIAASLKNKPKEVIVNKKIEEIEEKEEEAKVSEEVTKEEEAKAEEIEEKEEEAKASEEVTKEEEAKAEEVAKKAVEAERARVKGINALAFKGMKPELLNKLIEDGTPLEEAVGVVFSEMQALLNSTRKLNAYKENGAPILAEQDAMSAEEAAYSKWQALNGAEKQKFFEQNKKLITNHKPQSKEA